MNNILVTDIGSTTTKALLLRKEGSRFVQLSRADEPTTVESPFEDVMVGLFRAVDRISAESGIPLREESRLRVPYYSTSSAGGGLQILVVGLSKSETGKLAEAVTFGAGGVLLDSFSIDDKIPPVKKIQRMSTLSSDLVLMAGGHEGGAISGVVNMANMLSQASPRPKFGHGKMPVIFCGNTEAAPFVMEMLGSAFDVHLTDNIRPSREEINLYPAMNKVHHLFMEHVMKMAPGYAGVAESVVSPVLPTPAGVENILQLLSSGEEDAVLVDMGGATTDIFSVINGKIQRTVSANTGMSYSLSNILREAGPEVMRHLGGMDRAFVRDRVLQKTLFPTIHAEDEGGLLTEHACAAEGMRLAFERHLELCYRPVKTAAGLFGRKNKAGSDSVWRTLDDDERKFSMKDFKTLIGAGGVLSHTDTRRAAWILAQAFNPEGYTTLALDTRFHSPHMGVLSVDFPDMAREYYVKDCLRYICRVIRPEGRIRKDRPAMKIKGPHTDTEVRGGDFIYIPEGRGFSAGEWTEKENIPLLVDCRDNTEDPFPVDFEKKPLEIINIPNENFRKTILEGPHQMKHGFSLAYPGEIDVRPGQELKPGMVIGRNMLAPPRTYFVDVRRGSGYIGKELPTEKLMEHILVKPGDIAVSGMEIFRYDSRRYLMGNIYTFKSPVRGLVTDVLEPGVVRMQEIQDYDGKAHVIDVADPLMIKPSQMPGYLRVKKGDFVQREQAIAQSQKFKFVKSPTAGTVTDIDTKKGTVTVQYKTNPVYLYSSLHGTVTDIRSDEEIDISFEATVLEGVLGFGRDIHGPLRNYPSKDSIILTRDTINKSDIDNAHAAGASAIIGPSIRGDDLCNYLGETPGVLLTGDEEIPVSIMLVRGVGSAQIEDEVWNKLSSYEGRHGALFTTTRLRAGVERPRLLIQ